MEVLVYGTNEVVDINEDSENDMKIQISSHFSAVIRDLNNTQNYVSYLSQDFDESKFANDAYFTVLFIQKLQ